MNKWIRYYLKLLWYYIRSYPVVVAVVILWLSVFGIAGYVNFHKVTNYGYSANGWMAYQNQNLGNLQAMTYDLDMTYTMYICGYLDDTAFQDEIRTMLFKCYYLENEYETHKKNHPITSGQEVASTMNGISAYEAIWDDTEAILRYTRTNQTAMDRSKLAEEYLRYSHKTEENLDKFVSAYTLALIEERKENRE